MPTKVGFALARDLLNFSSVSTEGIIQFQNLFFAKKKKSVVDWKLNINRLTNKDMDFGNFKVEYCGNLWRKMKRWGWGNVGCAGKLWDLWLSAKKIITQIRTPNLKYLSSLHLPLIELNLSAPTLQQQTYIHNFWGPYFSGALRGRTPRRLSPAPG